MEPTTGPRLDDAAQDDTGRDDTGRDDTGRGGAAPAIAHDGGGTQSGDEADRVAVVAPDRLYVLSGMIDVLRDVTGSFVAQGVDPGRAAVDQAVRQYELVRNQLPGALTPAAAAELATWAVAMTADTGLAHLHLTLASVARYLDVLLQAPQFATQHRLLLAATDQTNRHLDGGGIARFATGEPGSVGAVEAAAGYQGGAYL